MINKKFAACAACIVAFSFLMACGSNSPKTVTETWTTPGSVESAWFNEASAPDLLGFNVDPETMRVGKTSDGKDIFSLLHLPMRGSLLAGEVESAKLYLKIVDGETPSSLRIGLANGFWGNVSTDLAAAKGLIDSASVTSIAVNKVDDGWISADLTGYVSNWLSGSLPNYGLVLLGEKDGQQTAFASGWDESSENAPRLEVKGAVGNRDLRYGKFAYLRHPENESDDAIIAENETANCLSYALRDTDVIGAEELGLDYSAMTTLYRQSGEDAVADYCAEKVVEYVERNKAGLQISNFRQIEGFDSEIDAKKEYRIAFRVGCKLQYADDVFSDLPGNFDYHVWAQINTGQWAQKYMFDPSEIVPGTPPGVSPEKYPWNSTLEWGWEKYYHSITSKAIYFAVTKDVDGFTQHKSR